jgi:hypothetical protein
MTTCEPFNQNNDARNQEQNAQRLGNSSSDADSLNILSDSIDYDQTLLEKRQALVASGKHKGNTKELKAYKAELPTSLHPYAYSWILGLLLSDASLQVNNSKSTCRVKIQQSENNKSLLFLTVEVLKPWMLSGVSSMKTRKAGTHYRETQTVSHEAFLCFATLLQNPTVPLQPQACIEKVIQGNILELLTPLAVAIWFAGDGGRQDYSENSGKAIQLHTQGFDKSSQEVLAEALRANFG